jgi:hypothetical protein
MQEIVASEALIVVASKVKRRQWLTKLISKSISFEFLILDQLQVGHSPGLHSWKWNKIH